MGQKSKEKGRRSGTENLVLLHPEVNIVPKFAMYKEYSLQSEY